MILIRRAADDPDDDPDDTSAPSPAANVPKQPGPTRPDAINVGDIARKPRPVTTALQKLYGI